jgi:O-antigen ligase
MKLALTGEPVHARRFVFLVALSALLCLVAAVIVLPEGFVRFAAITILALPFFFVALDRPAALFYVLIIVLFSNLDLLATFRLYRTILAFVVLALAIAVLNGRRLVWHHAAFLSLAAAFAIILLQSVSVARDYETATIQTTEYFKTLLAIAIAFQFVRDQSEFRRSALVVSIAILLTALAPLVVAPPTRLAALSLLWEEGVFRYEGFVLEPNQFAMIQLMLIPLLMFLLAVRRRSPVIVILCSVAILASVVMLVLSFSRGGFVGLIVLLLLLLIVERKNGAAVAIGMLLIVAGLALSPGVYWQRIQSMITFAQGNRFDLSIFTRIESMKEAIRLGLEHPLLGVGVDNFIYALGSVLPYRMIVHNTFLQVFAELGIIAFALFMGIIVYNFILIRGLMRRCEREAAQLGRLLFIQLAAVLASAFFIPVAYDYFFWFLLALPVMADYCYRERGGATQRAFRGAEIGN